MNQIVPPIMILLSGDGGNSKSARTLLRNNVWGHLHKSVSPTCFQKAEEPRIQGCHFSAAKLLTVQEVSPGDPVCEAELKKMISGEYLWCRPLFGKETKQYRWNRCGLRWEFNNHFFSIQGDPSNLPALRSWLRRFRALRLKACFTSDPRKVDIENCIFPEDSDIAPCWNVLVI